MKLNVYVNVNYETLDLFCIYLYVFVYYFIGVLMFKLSVQESWTMEIIRGNKVNLLKIQNLIVLCLFLHGFNKFKDHD